jgi:hypothetical protein
MPTNNACVIIMSCDKYSDLWQPFFHFFNKYWPDCPFNIYLSTNSKNFNQPKLTVLKSGTNSNWSDEALVNLKKINYKYIVYLQDDYLFLKKVNTKAILSLIEKMELYNCHYLRLFPSPGPDALFTLDNSLGLISENAAYRTSLQAAIWHKPTLEKIIKPGENSWEFEINSPARSKGFLFLSVPLNKKINIKQQLFPITYYYLTAVFKGKWVYGMKNILKKEGVSIDESLRPFETRNTNFKRNLYNKSPLLLKKILFKLKI